jgi:hypothetical protein
VRRPAIKPHQAVLAVGVLAALGTIASGILPRLTGWEETSPISRHVFGGVPDPIYWMFYATAATVLFICAWLISLRVRNYERGRPDDRRTNKGNVEHRMRDFRSGVWMQTLLRDPAAGVMHSFIYFGFLVLLAATIILEIDHQLPDDLKFLHGDVYQAYAATADVFGVVFVVGILWAMVRRYVQRPYRIRIKTKPEDAVILTTFLVIVITGFATIETAVEAMKKGAFDYLEKPLERDDLLLTLQRAFEHIGLLRENRALHKKLEESEGIPAIIGEHPKIKEVFRIINKIAPTGSTVASASIPPASGRRRLSMTRCRHDVSPWWLLRK